MRDASSLKSLSKHVEEMVCRFKCFEFETPQVFLTCLSKFQVKAPCIGENVTMICKYAAWGCIFPQQGVIVFLSNFEAEYCRYFMGNTR